MSSNKKKRGLEENSDISEDENPDFNTLRSISGIESIQASHIDPSNKRSSLSENKMNSEVDLTTDRTVKSFKATKNNYLSQTSDEVAV